MLILEIILYVIGFLNFAVAFLALAVNLAHALDPEIDELVQRSKRHAQFSEEEDDTDEFHSGVHRFGDRLPPPGLAA